MLNAYPFWINKIAADDNAGGTEETEANTEATSNDSDNAEENQPESNDSDGDLKAQNEKLKATLKEWQGYAREWEKKSKANLRKANDLEKKLDDSTANADSVRTLTEQRDQAVAEKTLVLTLASFGADVATLTDSRSFMEKATALDVEDDNFEEHLRETVQAHFNHAPVGARLFFEGNPAKPDLWEQVHGKENSK